jgi:microcystin-dependent protein
MSVSNSAPIIPYGVILPFAGLNVAEGWLPCSGAVYDPVLYPKLYETIGNIFGGTATFPRLPDLRGRYPVGFDTGVNAIGQVTQGTFSGTESFTLAEGNLPSLTFNEGNITITGTFTSPLVALENQSPTNTSTTFTDVVVSAGNPDPPVKSSRIINATTTGGELTYTNPNPVVPVSYNPVASVVAYAGYDILYVIKAGGF